MLNNAMLRNAMLSKAMQSNAEQCWSNLNKFYGIWTIKFILDKFDPFWTSLIQFGQVWSNLDKSDPIWTGLALLGWTHQSCNITWSSCLVYQKTCQKVLRLQSGHFLVRNKIQPFQNLDYVGFYLWINSFITIDQSKLIRKKRIILECIA